MDVELFAKPRENVSIEDCFFYHSMDIPGIGEVSGQWDLRAVAGQYLGDVDFRGKRVLDVGAASGYLSFEMEARGAEVVSFDMASGSQWNLVPYAENAPILERQMEGCQAVHERLRNAYWFTHNKLNSNAKVHYGDVYNLPVELGTFDVVFFGMILGHLRDPFQAMWSASRLCTGSVVITNQGSKEKKRWFRGRGKRFATATFMPSLENGEIDCWWHLSSPCLERMMEVLGFDKSSQVASRPQCLLENRYQREDCHSIVTRRVRGQAAVPPEPRLSKAG